MKLIRACMYCKRIQAVTGLWIAQPKELDQYPHFTHGVCPSCVHILEEEIEQLKAEG